MRVRVVVCCVFALVTGTLAAQPPAVVAPTDKDATAAKKVTWKVGDTVREALVYAPVPVAGKKRPVVIAFHGHGGKSEFSARQFRFHEIWPDAVIVYPQGLPTAVPVLDPNGRLPGWQKYVGDQKDRDLEFFDAMMKTLVADYQIDEKRVYVAGHSNGAFFAYVLCASRAEKIAAVAPVAGAMNLRDVKNTKPMPVLHVAGEKDRIVSFEAQERAMEQMRKINGCDADGKPAGKWCTEYTSKAGPLVVTMIHPGGHNIPQGAPERIVQFFKDQVKK